MKTLKKISISLIIILAVFASIEKDCFTFFDKQLYIVENSTNEDKSDNSFTSNIDLCEGEVALISGIYTFNLKNLSNEKVIISNFFIIQNLYFCIWQPPKNS